VPGDARVNAEQQAAVDAKGLVFVSAGAGTGKTRVLVERFVRAVCDHGLDVGSILVITYTKRAAGELRSRIRARLLELDRGDLARELDGAWISTIHGFCNRLLKTYPLAAGLDPRFRELDDAQGSVLRGEAFETALAEFCAGREPERLRLLATYGAKGLRRMLTGVFETLRSAGRELVLELGERPSLPDAVARLADAAQCLVDDTAATETQRAAAARALEVLESDSSPERLLDLDGLKARGERAASYDEARRAVEQAALDEAAAHDRVLLEELLVGFAREYQAAKDRESVLDFEDLQLRVRDLLRANADIRAREQLRFRSIMVDEFQDTNRLQCELIDLLSSRWPAAAPAGQSPAPPPPDAAGRRDHLRGRTTSTVSPALAPPAAPQRLEDASRDPFASPELFFVGDEFQSIYGFRHADVSVFRERRAASPQVLPLTRNYRSRPEVLAVVNELFAGEFGQEFQPLHSSGEFPDPVFGSPAELLVTDKSSYAGTDVHWRRAEAQHIAKRVKELVDNGDAEPGEIVLLFAAGTDAEWYEEELRKAGLRTYRSTGRGYFGQQQVVDLLAYLRLLHNRYDDEALLTVLASPLVGVSNDALVLIRRAASRRPIFAGLEKSLPPALAERDARLLRAFQQRFDRLAGLSTKLSLELLCERIVSEHDYDLAVLAHWDGRRRYANLRKLARLARSYEELRGADVEGFVRFVSEQEAVGARELEAVAEEEGGDAIRLLTIHAAKGLEFKVVVVADAGRDRQPPAPDEILALSDGRFGFKVAHPSTGERRGASGYDEVRASSKREEEAERLRLYYVAMTRAVDRLIVSGAIDPERPSERTTPIGWVLDRLDARGELATAGRDPVELERGGARLLVRVDRGTTSADTSTKAVDMPADVVPTQLALFSDDGEPAPPVAPRLPELVPIPLPALEPVRRLSFTALASFENCSYRYYAERLVGMKALRPAPQDGEADSLGALDVGDAVHRLLETIDLRDPHVVDLDRVREWYPRVTEDELERIAAFVAGYCASPLAKRVAALDDVRAEVPFTFEHDGVLIRGFVDVMHRAGERALVVDYKTNVIGDAAPDEIVEQDYRLQRLVYALACFRSGAREVEVVYHFLERPDATVSAVYAEPDVPVLEAELSAAIARIQGGQFVPTPSEYACAGCPALDVICAGPRLRAAPRHLEAFAPA
jgi:ATP-dependent helicase/nuclease subunit A